MSGAQPGPVVEVRDAVKVYRTGFLRRRVYALRGISFDVMPGEIFGVIGPNGAGKSTAFKLITGLAVATAGVLRIAGRDASDPAARRMLGYMPEHPKFPAELTALEAAAMHGRLAGLAGAEARRQAALLLDEAGLAHARHQRVGSFSKGMVQRLAMAVALMANPRVLVLDEPLDGLDPQGRRDLAGMMAAAAERGAAVIFSSHILADVARLAARTAVIAKGQIRALAATAALFSAQAMGYELLARVPGGAALAWRGAAQRESHGGQVRGLFDDGNAAAAALHEVAVSGGEVLYFGRAKVPLENYFVRELAA